MRKHPFNYEGANVMIINRKMHRQMHIIHRKIQPTLDRKQKILIIVSYSLLSTENKSYKSDDLYSFVQIDFCGSMNQCWAHFCENYWFLFSHWVVRAGVVLAKIYIFFQFVRTDLSRYEDFFWENILTGSQRNWFSQTLEHLLISTFL